MKFRKKPVKIDAMQFDGSAESAQAVVSWANSPSVTVSSVPSKPPLRSMDWVVSIETLEGTMVASKGDWVIRGVKGELYPCKPEIFDDTYDSMSDREVEIDTKRGSLVLEVGDADWNPTQEDLQKLSDLFMAAELDPNGSVVAVRRGISVKSLGGNAVENYTILSVGGPDWSPTQEDLANAVRKVTSGMSDRLAQVIREGLSRATVSTVTERNGKTGEYETFAKVRVDAFAAEASKALTVLEGE